MRAFQDDKTPPFFFLLGAQTPVQFAFLPSGYPNTSLPHPGEGQQMGTHSSLGEGQHCHTLHAACSMACQCNGIARWLQELPRATDGTSPSAEGSACRFPNAYTERRKTHSLKSSMKSLKCSMKSGGKGMSPELLYSAPHWVKHDAVCTQQY